jgi:hypothetical protein
LRGSAWKRRSARERSRKKRDALRRKSAEPKSSRDYMRKL